MNIDTFEGNQPLVLTTKIYVKIKENRTVLMVRANPGDMQLYTTERNKQIACVLFVIALFQYIVGFGGSVRLNDYCSTHKKLYLGFLATVSRFSLLLNVLPMQENKRISV